MTYTGFLQVEVGRKRGRSVVTNSYFDGVLKITRPTYLEGDLPLLTLIHVGGGYVDGDTYKTEIIVKEYSRLALTTQASTKVYKSLRFGVTQTMDYFLDKGCELYVKQDSLIPYKDSNFTQYTNVYMSSSSTFFYTDIITPGWSENGQPFQYSKVQTKMKIFMDGSLIVFDHMLLKPDELMNKILLLEGYTHIGTLFFIHGKVNDNLIDQLRTKLSSYSSITRIGVSSLSVNGISLRVLANSTTVIERIFSDCESFVMEHLGQQGKITWRKG